MKTSAKNIIGILQISVILILFSTMLFLCGSYIYSQSKGLITVLPAIPDSEKWILSANPDTGGEKESSILLVPGFIGYSSGGERLAVPYDKPFRKTAFSQLENSMGLLFSGSEKELSFDLPVQKTDYLNKLLGREFIYLGFYGELPSAAIFPFIAKGYENKSNVLVSYVSSLYLLPDNSGNLYGVAIDRMGNFTELRPKEPSPFNKEQLMAYTNKAELIPFDFALVDEAIPVALFSKSLQFNEAVTGLPAVDISAGSGAVKDILRAFGYNPNNANFYTSPDDSVSFVENPGEITIKKDGQITFIAANEGIPLSEFVGYYPSLREGEKYSFTDIVYAVKLFINSLDSAVFGKDAVIGITDISYEEKTSKVIFTLRYFLDGVELPCINPQGLSLSFVGSDLVSAHLEMQACVKASLLEKDISQKTAFAIIQNDIKLGSFLSFGPTYVKNREAEEGTVYTPVWTLRTTEGEVTQ